MAGRKAFKWLPEHDALLGTMSDKDAALSIGVSVTAVCTRRRELSINPKNQYNRKNKPFGDFLRNELKTLNITQADAANLFDVSQSLVEAWIAGENKSWGKVPSKLERAGIFSILKNKRFQGRI
jgi:hypothetical protein